MEAFLQIFKSLTPLFFKYPLRLFKFILYEAKSGAGPIRILKRIWFNAHILTENIDFLHFCFGEVAIQKELVSKALGIPMSVSLRGSDILIYGPAHPGCYQRLWKNADKFHAVSNWIIKNAISLGLPTQKKHQVIYDGIIPENIPFNHFDIHTPVRFVTVGRLEQEKDHIFSLSVARKLLDAGVNFNYTIIGDGTLRPLLISKIKELGLEKNVIINGSYPHRELLNTLSSFDVYIHCSLSEGFGVSLLEAQASGLLTVSLDSGATKENIEEDKSGWIVKERDALVMCNKIIQLLNLPSVERTRVKDYARRRIENDFDLKNYLPAWKNFFEN